MKVPSSVHIKRESDMFVADRTLVCDSKGIICKKHKRQSNGTEDVTSDSEASSSQSLLRVKKKKFSEMVGKLDSENNSPTVKKKKKTSVDFLTQEIFKQSSDNSTASGVCDSMMLPVQNIKQEVELDSTVNGLLDVHLTKNSTQKDKKKWITGLNLSNISHQNCSTIDFGTQDIFNQSSSEEFVYSKRKKIKKEKNKDRNCNDRDVRDGKLSPKNEIKLESTLNSIADGLQDVFMEHLNKKKKNDKTPNSNLQHADETSSLSCRSAPYTSDSNELFQPHSCFVNSTPKKSKKKKHKVRNGNGSDVKDSRMSPINEVDYKNTMNSSTTTDGSHNSSIEHSTKKNKKDKTKLQGATKNSRFSCSIVPYPSDSSEVKSEVLELPHSCVVNSTPKTHKKKRKKDVERVMGVNLSNLTHQNSNIFAFGSQDIFNQPSWKFKSSDHKQIKKEKNEESSGNVRDGRMSPINKIEPDNTLNSTTHGLQDVSTKKQKKDKNLNQNGNLQHVDEYSSFSYSPLCSKSSQLNDSFDTTSDNSKVFTELDESEIKWPCRKRKKKKKHGHMEEDGTDICGNRMNETDDFFCHFCHSSYGNYSNISRNGNTSLDNGGIIGSRIDEETRSDKNENINKVKKKKREKNVGKANANENKNSILKVLEKYLDDNRLEDVELTSQSSSFLDSCESNRVDDAANDVSAFMTVDDIDEKKNKASCTKSLHESIILKGNGSDQNLDTSMLDFSSDRNIVDSKDNLDGNQPTVENIDTGKKNKTKRKKSSHGSIILKGNGSDKDSVTSLLDLSSDVYDDIIDSKDNLDGNRPIVEDIDTGKKNKTKRKKYSHGSIILNGDGSDKDSVTSLLDLSSDVYDDIIDSKDHLDGNRPIAKDIDIGKKNKTKRKKSSHESIILNGNGSDKHLDASLLDLSSDLHVDIIDSKDNLDRNMPIVSEFNSEKRKKEKRKKFFSESIILNGNDSDKGVDTSQLDFSIDVYDHIIDSKNNLDVNQPTVENIDTGKKNKTKRKKYLSESIILNGNGSDKDSDTSLLDLSSDVYDDIIDSKGNLDGNRPIAKDIDTGKKNKAKRKKSLNKSIMLNGNESDKDVDTLMPDFSSDVSDNNIDSKGSLDVSCLSADDIDTGKTRRNTEEDIDSNCTASAQQGKNPEHNESDDASKCASGPSKKIKVDDLYMSDSDEGIDPDLDKLDVLKCALGSLVIDVDFPVPHLHTICNRSSKPTPEQRLKVAKLKIPVKNGKFVVAEDRKIQENWTKFMQMYNFEDKPELFFSLQKKYISVKEKQNFLFFLAQGLDDRTPYSVHQRFKLLMSQLKRGRFTKEEDAYIKAEIEENRGTRSYIAQIAQHLQRPFNSVERRIMRLEAQHTRKIRWKRYNLAAFIKYLLVVTRTKPAAIEKLKDRHITSAEWTRLSEKLDDVPTRILIRAWFVKIHPMLFIPEARCDMRKVKVKLVNLLFENNEHEWRAVDWKYYASHFEGLTPLRIYSALKTLVLSKVPPRKRTNLKKCLDILRKYTIDDLGLHFIYKVKYVDGEIIQLMKTR